MAYVQSAQPETRTLETDLSATCPRILVVDDNRDNLDLITEIFAHEPWNVRTAGGAQEAWEMLKDWRPDLVLLDIEMPVFTGYELCTAMGMKPHLNEIPVIFLTAAYTGRKDVARGLQMGACDYICKPVDAGKLRERVRTALAEHPRPALGAKRTYQ